MHRGRLLVGDERRDPLGRQVPVPSRQLGAEWNLPDLTASLRNRTAAPALIRSTQAAAGPGRMVKYRVTLPASEEKTERGYLDKFLAAFPWPD